MVPTQGEGRVSSAGSGGVASMRGGLICIYRQDLLSDAVFGGEGALMWQSNFFKWLNLCLALCFFSSLVFKQEL